MKKEEELKIRISAEDKERIRFKMEESGILNMSAYVRKMALDGICVKICRAALMRFGNCPDSPLPILPISAERQA